MRQQFNELKSIFHKRKLRITRINHESYLKLRKHELSQIK